MPKQIQTTPKAITKRRFVVDRAIETSSVTWAVDTRHSQYRMCVSITKAISDCLLVGSSGSGRPLRVAGGPNVTLSKLL
jgi:hypothetical protein